MMNGWGFGSGMGWGVGGWVLAILLTAGEISRQEYLKTKSDLEDLEI